MTNPAREALAALRERAARDVDDGPLPSCQYAVARHGELLAFETLGTVPAGDESTYVMYSCTKAVVAAMVWALVSDGHLQFTTPVVDVLPAFGPNGKDVVTVDHLLTMTAGFPNAPLGPPAWWTSATRREAFTKWWLDWEPGTRCVYHPSSAHWVLAEMITEITGTDYRAALTERILAPLGLSMRLGSTGDEQQFTRLTLAGTPPTPEQIEVLTGIAGIELPEITDEALLRFNDPEVRALGQPSAGVVGTAADLAMFYQGLLDDRLELWDPDVLVDGTSVVRTGDLVDPVRGVAALRTRGVQVAGDVGGGTRRGFGRRASPRTFGHDGAGGQIAWADPDTGISFAYLTNGMDANPIRMARRGVSLSDRAAAIFQE
jgi:CubicO group peptidase (beta-lactamase class C family)